MACNDCGNTKIKVRRNYSHGRKSKPHIIRVCARCGSMAESRETTKKRRWR